MVSALAMGVPPITYGWGYHKYLEVLREFDATDLYASYDAMTMHDFRSKIELVESRSDAIRKNIKAGIEHTTNALGDFRHQCLSLIDSAGE
jgi:hypothetical protein